MINICIWAESFFVYIDEILCFLAYTKFCLSRVSTQTSSMLSEFRDTQRNVAKCLSEAEQARKDYIMFKEKTEAILFQLQQVWLNFQLQ